VLKQRNDKVGTKTQYPSLSFPNFGRSDVLSETWNIGMNFRDELAETENLGNSFGAG
jgi:hypothetical protein